MNLNALRPIIPNLLTQFGKRLIDKQRECEMLTMFYIDNFTLEEIAEKRSSYRERVKTHIESCILILQKTPSEKEQKMIDFAKSRLVELNNLKKMSNDYEEFCEKAHEEIVEAENNTKCVGNIRVRKVRSRIVSTLTNQHEKTRIMMKKNIHPFRQKLKDEIVEIGLYKKTSIFDPLDFLEIYNYYN